MEASLGYSVRLCLKKYFKKKILREREERRTEKRREREGEKLRRDL